MTELSLKPKITILDGRPMTTSLAVAEHFEKLHRDVLRAIADKVRQLADPVFTDKHFPQTTYLDSLGRSYPMFRLSHIGFSMTVMGFTGAKALAWQRRYAEAFDAMEQAGQLGRIASHDQKIAQLQADIHELKRRNTLLEAAVFAGTAKERDTRIELARWLADTFRRTRALELVKTRWVTDQYRVSAVEVVLRLIYATTASEAAVLWVLIQSHGLVNHDRGIKISVNDLLKQLHPHIKSPATISYAASRLAARGLVTVSRGHPTSYAVNLEQVCALIEKYDAKWLGLNPQRSDHLVPGLTDLDLNRGEAAQRFDLLLPKSPSAVIRRVESATLAAPAVVAEEWWSLERAFQLLPDPYTKANAVELHEPTTKPPKKAR